jgi:diguanylate cyclase (GGDEF)-like protein
MNRFQLILKQIKSKTYLKYILFPLIIIASLLISSYIFYSQINKLRQHIDTIYFGNFVSIHKLHNIVEAYDEILLSKKYFEVQKTIIEENWEYYYNSYKDKEEKKILNVINNQIKKSLKKRDTKQSKIVIKQILLTIDHEIASAAIQRKSFLQKYNQMKTYLFYNILAIILFALLFAILSIYEMIKRHKALEKSNHEFKMASRTDSLTKLYNRQYFDKIFDKMASISKTNSWTSAFIMLDIDHFKQYNDTYGHEQGDVALKEVAKALKAFFNKEYEYVFRIGGEEFGIIIFNTNKTILINCLEQFINHIHQLNIEHKTSSVTSKIITVSMGVMIVDNNNYDITPRDLYVSADKKLYNSKENGRDQYTL